MLNHLLLWSSIGFAVCFAHVTFTNLKCSFTNKNFGEFELCRIKAVNRTHKYVSITATPRIILENITSNLRLMRYDNGYKPFFIDITIDVCKYLKNPRNVIVTTIYNTFRENSNMNHTCPYDHSLIIDKLWTGNLEQDFGKFLPTPNGDFALFTTFYRNQKMIGQVNIYLKLFRKN